MYVDSCHTGKYTRHLLRESYRDKGAVKHRTLANISHCSAAEVEAIRLALKHKHDLAALGAISTSISLRQGLSVGAVWLVFEVAKRLGIVAALGSSVNAKLALWQVIARVIDQGSRLSAVRLASSHAACDLLGLEPFDEEDLYPNLDWLSENQTRIEDQLLRHGYPNSKPQLFLYDVTSSYLEGAHNEYAAFGYNRDGKKGKRQIVIGLLCDQEGRPLSIEVFPGNTQDPATFASQVGKAADRLGGGEVTFVGDRGMIKAQQVKDLLKHEFHYITAITKPQIERLLKKGVFSMSLFDQELAEIETEDGIRYVLRRNPIRAQEVQVSREDRLNALRREIQRRNDHLREHSRAQLATALKKAEEKNKRLKLSGWAILSATDRVISIRIDQDALSEEKKLDGCYVLKTDLSREALDKEKVHARYKDLALVEWAFRSSKTVELEMRPIFVRLKSRTRGHAMVVMLGYLVIRELARCWVGLDLTVEEGLKELTTLAATEVMVKGTTCLNSIPTPRQSVSQLFAAAKVVPPKALPGNGTRVATRKKLPENRKSK
jgi:hypothetical protein